MQTLIKRHLLEILTVLMIGVVGFTSSTLSAQNSNLSFNLTDTWSGQNWNKSTPHPAFVNPIEVTSNSRIDESYYIIGSDNKVYYNELNRQTFSGPGWPMRLNPFVPTTAWNLATFLPDKKWVDIGMLVLDITADPTGQREITFVLSDDGEIWSWGGHDGVSYTSQTAENHDGMRQANPSLQGVTGTSENILTPTLVQVLDGSGTSLNWDRMEVTNNAVFARTIGGVWYSWGYQRFRSTTPITSCGLLQELNGSGGCVGGITAVFVNAAPATRLTPAPKDGYKKFSHYKSNSAGGDTQPDNLYWITEDDELYTNRTGLDATKVDMPAGVIPTHIDAGSYGVIILGDDGKVYYWGALAGPDGNDATDHADAATLLSAAVLIPSIPSELNIIDIIWWSDKKGVGLSDNGLIYGWGAWTDLQSTTSSGTGSNGVQNFWWWKDSKFEITPTKFWNVSYGTQDWMILDGKTNGLFRFKQAFANYHETIIGMQNYNEGPERATHMHTSYQPWPLSIANDPFSPPASTTNSSGDDGLAGTLDCNATQILGSLIAGTTSDVVLRIDVDITVSGGQEITVDGSGLALKSDPYAISTAATGAQTFYIPLVYDGSALGSFTFGFGDGTQTCTADLSSISPTVLTTVDNVIDLGSSCSAITPANISK